MEYFNVGRIVNTQGLKGEVRVIAVTDFPEERFKKGSILYLFQTGKEPLELEITSHRKHKNFNIVSFKGYSHIEDVEHFRDGMLKVAKTDLTELSDGEFYYHEIIGLIMEDEEGNHIGEVKEILSPGANDVWVVEQPNGSQVYIPYIPSVIKKVDVEQGKIIAELMEGLIDED